MKDRATLDSNVLVYCELEPWSEKGRRAFCLIGAAAPRGVVAVQALLEFTAVVRRKRPELALNAATSVEAWSNVFELASTTPLVAQAAGALARSHNLQIWDAVIWSAARQAGATVFFSEDMQDGLVLDGMRVINPFALSDDVFDALIAA